MHFPHIIFIIVFKLHLIKVKKTSIRSTDFLFYEWKDYTRIYSMQLKIENRLINPLLFLYLKLCHHDQSWEFQFNSISRTLYVPRLFHRAQISEDRLLWSEVSFGQKFGDKVKNMHLLAIGWYKVDYIKGPLKMHSETVIDGGNLTDGCVF
jgi:hypothetical protein